MVNKDFHSLLRSFSHWYRGLQTYGLASPSQTPCSAGRLWSVHWSTVQAAHSDWLPLIAVAASTTALSSRCVRGWTGMQLAGASTRTLQTTMTNQPWRAALLAPCSGLLNRSSCVRVLCCPDSAISHADAPDAAWRHRDVTLRNNDVMRWCHVWKHSDAAASRNPVAVALMLVAVKRFSYSQQNVHRERLYSQKDFICV